MMALAALIAIGWSFYFAAVGLSWLAGFWLNGYYGFHFELASCWQGLSIAIGAIPTVWGLSATGIAKYKTDSIHNSKDGVMPGSEQP